MGEKGAIAGVATACRRRLGTRRTRLFLPFFIFNFSFLIPTPITAKNGDEPLNFYGLVTLADTEAGQRLAGRFKAKGQPVFLVHDLNAGLGQGDIMRFADKAVLVDPDVWNTLQAEGALEKLRAAPLVRVQGQARSGSWEQRSGLVTGERQQKAYKLGAELIRVLEETFGSAPLQNRLLVEFQHGHLTLVAPAALLDQLRFAAVRKVAKAGGPRMVSALPDSQLFLGTPFSFAVWAVDPTEPEGALKYSLRGEPPPGLLWDAVSHTLKGAPSAEGRWHLSAEARNAKGLRDTLGFTLIVRRNRPPVLGGLPRPVAVSGKEWRFRPEPADPDHPGYALRIRPGKLPAGMAFEADSNLLRWTPDSAQAGTRQTFSLAVEDPLGGRAESQYAVQVVAADAISWTEGVRVELPWDTLLQGQTYTWQAGATAAAWAGQGIVLQAARGSDSTWYSEGTLRLRPTAPGMHRLEFRFLVQGEPMVHRVFLPVREDKPPAFVTELMDWKVKTGDKPPRYRPVAVDPEAQAVSLAAEIPEGSPLAWNGRTLSLHTEEPGIYPARLTATDPGGREAEQWVAIRALPPDRRVRWFLENRVQGGKTVWSAAADFGTGRLGLFSPNLAEVLSLNAKAGREWPFIFFGGNLMGRANEAKGRRLWTDLGFTLRLPDSRIATGGVYGRILGEWAMQKSLLAWVEAEFTAHVHQALVLADTGSFRFLINDPDILIRIQRFEEISREIIADATAKDNAVFYTRFEALADLGLGFYGGPGLWREDWPMDQRFYQRAGGVFRFRSSVGQLISQVSLRAGWGPGGAGFDFHGAMRISLGSQF